MTTVPAGDFTLLAGRESLSEYRWNTRVARHYFCRVCGIYTHHTRRVDPTQYGVNVGCLEDVDPLALPAVAVADGAALSRVDN